MKHLREKIHFPCFQFRKVVQHLTNISAKHYENPAMLCEL